MSSRFRCKRCARWSHCIGAPGLMAFPYKGQQPRRGQQLGGVHHARGNEVKSLPSSEAKGEGCTVAPGRVRWVSHKQGMQAMFTQRRNSNTTHHPG